MSQDFSRGSEWRKWDMHIHTPASYQWKGARFRDMTPEVRTSSIDDMIKAMNESDVEAFVIMDYWTFDGWLALKKRLAEDGAPSLTKAVFPGIELRLVSPTSYRLNAHAIFSNEATVQELSDFKAALNVALIEQPLSNECLIKLARTKIGDDKLRKIGANKADIVADEKKAFDVGASCAEISAESYKQALLKFPEGKIIPFIPWDTYNGLAEANWEEHYSYVKGLMSINPIFETRNHTQIAAFNGVRTDGNQKWIAAFQASLGNRPHLAVSGSDAHRYKGTPSDDNARGYGDFPSSKATWINADTTFQGLLQAMKEPAKRCFIGEIPPKKKVYNENKTFFVDQILVSKKTDAQIGELWMDGEVVKLNPDLVAIIGNKGSGKSALADILALLGNTKQTHHFSFLKDKRFRGKRGEPAKSFIGELTWASGTKNSITLSDDPAQESVQMIRYIPQGLFEDLCNGHASGNSNAFEKELSEVIFSHLPADKKLDALDFDELAQRLEHGIREELAELRKELKKLNETIALTELRLSPEVKSALLEQIKQKQLQIEEHDKIKPIEILAPSDSLSAAQLAASEEIAQINARIAEVDALLLENNAGLTELRSKQSGINLILDKLEIYKRQFERISAEIMPDLTKFGFDVADIIKYEIVTQPLTQANTAHQISISSIEDVLQEISNEKTSLQSRIEPLSEQLNGPQKEFQAYTQRLAEWQKRKDELAGDSSTPDSLNGLQSKLTQIDALPQALDLLRNRRDKISFAIFDVLTRQKNSREELYTPVQTLIEGNRLIREEYKLQFQSNLDVSESKFTTLLFDIIKRTSGKYRGEDESAEAIHTLFAKYDITNRDQLIPFCKELLSDIRTTYVPADVFSIAPALKKDHKPEELYDFIYGLEYINPRYSLQFQNTPIEQLSPGQRGALLLIFYLLVDNGFNPIVLDQPEDNLDNETVVSLLVPVLTEAKKRRQIIMVTHNPNLAVVCDAEQVIYSNFDRANKCKISYKSGSIENPEINKHIIDVLEGTRPAFDNRSEKYI